MTTTGSILHTPQTAAGRAHPRGSAVAALALAGAGPAAAPAPATPGNPGTPGAPVDLFTAALVNPAAACPVS